MPFYDNVVAKRLSQFCHTGEERITQEQNKSIENLDWNISEKVRQIFFNNMPTCCTKFLENFPKKILFFFVENENLRFFLTFLFNKCKQKKEKHVLAPTR